LKISIVIPTRNAALDIAACLQALQGQSFRDFEVHVLDGQSTDGTGEAVRAYQGRVGAGVHWHCRPDHGVYDAMNKGVGVAQGEWLYFMGADDVLHDKDVLADVARCLTEGGVDIVYGDVLLKTTKQRLGGASSLHRLLFECNICHQALFYHRSVFDKLGPFNLRYPIWADWDFNIRCFRHPCLRSQWIDRVIAVYNDLPGRLSSCEDPVFAKELPVILLREAQQRQAELDALGNSRSYRLGQKFFGWLD
jgi:glycosyltransferase involved in cell wall biosynthesis